MEGGGRKGGAAGRAGAAEEEQVNYDQWDCIGFSTSGSESNLFAFVVSNGAQGSSQETLGQ